MKTVWILGAGFSRPLGGPLLPELFSIASAQRVGLCYPQDFCPRLHDDAASRARALYRHFGPQAPGGNPQHWADAEEFLDALDTAVLAYETVGERSPSWKVILSLGGTFGANCVPHLIASSARRIMAAECSTFLKDADPDTEKWAPFRRWSAQLGPDDTIVTFNYDLVPEKLASVGGNLEVVLPGQQRQDITKCPVLKLHGSVNWRRRNGVVEQALETFALHAEKDSELVIASPGPAKRLESERLEVLWAGAEVAIRNAEAIVFVGYRFPPTDASARKRLIGAIEGNERASVLCLHTVLGPNTSDPAVQRLRSLLQHAMRMRNRQPAPPPADPDRLWQIPTEGGRRWFTLDVHPLYGQDFLDLYVPGHVTQAYRFPRA